MRAATLTLSALLTALLLGLAMWLFDYSFTDAALLAPVIVATAGVSVFLGVLWTKIVIESLRRTRHPVAVLGAFLGGLGLLVALSFFVDLPRMGH